MRTVVKVGGRLRNLCLFKFLKKAVHVALAHMAKLDQSITDAAFTPTLENQEGIYLIHAQEFHLNRSSAKCMDTISLVL